MSWKIALLVALLNALIAAIVSAPVSDWIMDEQGVSSFEGARGMAVVFLFIPAGFIGGFLLGLLGTKLVNATQWGEFWKAFGMSVLLAQGAIFAIAGLNLLGIPRPPLLDGQQLALEVEIYVPLARITPNARQPDQIRVSLFASSEDNSYADVDQQLFREEQGMLIVPATAQLNSKASNRLLSFLIEQHTALTVDLDSLPAMPTAKDLEWSSLLPMRESKLTGTKYTFTDVQMRYRVMKTGQQD
jgi:hypothetical protein